MLSPHRFVARDGMYPDPFSSSLLKVPGADLQNVCMLQTPEDSSKVLELATGKNLVIIGASFVGTRLERASNHQW